MTSAAGTYTGTSQLDGIFKKVYADRVNEVVPETDILAKDIPFVGDAEKEGDSYNMPVELTRESGFTFNGTTGDVFTLNYPISAIDKNALVNGTEFVLRAAVSYGAMQKALKASTGKAGARAFVNATKYKVANMVRSASYAREVSLLYGGGSAFKSNLGAIEATTGSSGTTLVAKITAATWSLGIWAGMINAEFDLYTTGGTKQNTNGTAGAADSVYKVTAVDPSTRTVTFTSHADNVTAASVGEVFVFAGAYQKDMLGIDGMINTSGTLWNISNSTYDLWAPSSHSVGGALTFEECLAGLKRPAALGFRGTMCLYVNPTSFEDLNADQAALRRHDKAGGKVVQGNDAIEFYSQTGSLKIKPHIYVKQGEAFAIPLSECMRVGATDITFEMPDGKGQIFRHMEDKAGLEIRCYWNQAWFCRKPAFCVKYTGITPSNGV